MLADRVRMGSGTKEEFIDLIGFGKLERVDGSTLETNKITMEALEPFLPFYATGIVNHENDDDLYHVIKYKYNKKDDLSRRIISNIRIEEDGVLVEKASFNGYQQFDCMIELSTLATPGEVEGEVIFVKGSDIIYKCSYKYEDFGVACYLTSCMVNYYGKHDDGIELTSMRKLREKYKYKHVDILAEYERVSPHIIQGIEQSGNRGYWYNEIKKVVDKIVIWVSNEEWEKAEVAYLDLYYKLKEKFYSEGD